MTVEATCLLPLVMFIIIFLIYIGFYMYDKCLAKQDNSRELIRLEQIKWKSDEVIMAEYNELESEWYYDKYICFDKGDKALSVSDDSLGITQTSELVAPNIVPLDPFDKKWTICDETSGKRYDVVRILRDIRKAGSLLNG